MNVTLYYSVIGGYIMRCNMLPPWKDLYRHFFSADAMADALECTPSELYHWSHGRTAPRIEKIPHIINVFKHFNLEPPLILMEKLIMVQRRRK